MSDMADVLRAHQPTSKLLSPSDVRVACLCGEYAQDHELPTYHNDWIIKHQAAALSAAGYGPVREAQEVAWDEGCEEATEHYAAHAYDRNSNGPVDPPRNPYWEASNDDQ